MNFKRYKVGDLSAALVSVVEEKNGLFYCSKENANVVIIKEEKTSISEGRYGLSILNETRYDYWHDHSYRKKDHVGLFMYIMAVPLSLEIKDKKTLSYKEIINIEKELNKKLAIKKEEFRSEDSVLSIISDITSRVAKIEDESKKEMIMISLRALSNTYVTEMLKLKENADTSNNLERLELNLRRNALRELAKIEEEINQKNSVIINILKRRLEVK